MGLGASHAGIAGRSRPFLTVILTGHAWLEGVAPWQLTSVSFGETLGHTGVVIVAVSTALFAYSTLIGWNYSGEKAIEYLAGRRAIAP